MVGCKFANGYVSLFIIPYGGKAGSGLDHCVYFVIVSIIQGQRVSNSALEMVGDARVLSTDLSFTFMSSFQMLISHPTVTDVNSRCVQHALGDYMSMNTRFMA